MGIVSLMLEIWWFRWFRKRRFWPRTGFL